MKIYNGLDEFKKLNFAVVTSGTFDGVHFGHQKILRRLDEITKKNGGESVLLTYWPHPRLVLFPHQELFLLSSIEEKVLVPTVHTLKRSRNPFKGVLYAGLMLTNQGPKVLEYNVRFGDPECQPILMRLKTDLVDILEATVDTKLSEIGPLDWDPRPAVCVVMASEGYPGSYETGKVIRGIEEADKLDSVKVFHAGTTMSGDDIVTNGGRVLGVTAMGNSIATAKLQAYTAVKQIRWEGAWCRKDISDKALG